jgi:pimeloyl-ACP methyl ester carboxylesterase
MKTEYFERPEGKLVYDDYGGTGETVVMLPGLGALRSEYRYLAPKLSEAGYRAITVDLRGHGESSVPWRTYDIPSVGSDILALINYLNIEPAHIIGASFAAGAAVWASVESPKSIRSLILISGSVRSGRTNPMMRALVWLMMNNPWRVRTWVTYYKTLYPTRKPEDFQDYLQNLQANLSEQGRFSAAVAFTTCSRAPSEERLNRVEVPTLVLMGMKDPDFPDPVAEGKYIAHETGGSLDLIDGAGHYPQTEVPEKTTPILINFLKQTGNSKKVRK